MKFSDDGTSALPSYTAPKVSKQAAQNWVTAQFGRRENSNLNWEPVLALERTLARAHTPPWHYAHGHVMKR